MSESDKGLKVIDLAGARAAKRKAGRPTTITATGLAAALRDAKAGKSYTRQDPAVGGLELLVVGASARREGYVQWSLRCRIRGDFRIEGSTDPLAASTIARRMRRLALGDHRLPPERAREYSHRVKDWAKQGLDPAPLLRQLITGVPITQQQEIAAKTVTSIPFETAKAQYLAAVQAARRPATYDDYRKTLDTPELQRLNGRMVAEITPEEIAEIVAEIAQRAHPLADHVRRVVSAMWTWLADATRRRATGVLPHALRGVKTPDAARIEIGDPNAKREEDATPATKIELGRTLAIARSGALGPRWSAAIMLLLGSAQRRRAVSGANRGDFKPMVDGEVLWGMPPYYRKTANKRRSQARHYVPLIGWAAEAERVLDRMTIDAGWYLPVGRTRPGERPKAPHADPRQIAKRLEWIGAGYSPHAIRRAFATYGTAELGWMDDDPKLILDHLEGHDPGDVTAQHYNLNPAFTRKRAMMRAWISFLDTCEAEAVAADPTLADPTAQRELIYRRRYGDEAWRNAIKRAEKRLDGRLPWSDPPPE